jgi:hypothetical protein
MKDYINDNQDIDIAKTIGKVAIVGGLIGVGTFMAIRFRVAKPDAEAKGILAIKDAEAEGLMKILNASQGDSKLTQFYLGLNKELPQTQYKEAANTLRGLNPKVHIWNTGNTEGNGNPVSNVFADMAMKLIPTLDATKDDIKLPSYLPQHKSD